MDVIVSNCKQLRGGQGTGNGVSIHNMLWGNWVSLLPIRMPLSRNPWSFPWNGSWRIMRWLSFCPSFMSLNVLSFLPVVMAIHLTIVAMMISPTQKLCSRLKILSISWMLESQLCKYMFALSCIIAGNYSYVRVLTHQWLRELEGCLTFQSGQLLFFLSRQIWLGHVIPIPLHHGRPKKKSYDTSDTGGIRGVLWGFDSP